jgi:hypothetical protein
MVYKLSNVPNNPVLSLNILNEEAAVLVICTIPIDLSERFSEAIFVVFCIEPAGDSCNNPIGKLVSDRDKIVPNIEQIR